MLRRMKRLITSIIATLFIAFPCHGAPGNFESVTEVPFTIEQGIVIATMMIHGDEPVEVALATGAEFSLFNPQTLKKYKLLAAPIPVGPSLGRSSYPAIYVTSVSDVRFGDLRLRSLYLRSGEQTLTAISSRVGREIFAVLGADFFKGRVVRFDFVKKLVSFLPKIPTDQLNNKSVLKMQAAAEGIQRPIVKDINFNGKPVNSLVDTGAPTSVSLTPAGAKRLGFICPSENSEARGEKISSLQFGKIETSNLQVWIQPNNSEFDRRASGYDAVIGIAVLQNLIVTFDYGKRVVIVERDK